MKRSIGNVEQSFVTEDAKTPAKRARVVASLQKVISGGQTGADRAALEAALAQGIATGGTAPIGFVTCDAATGDISLKEKFGLTELPLSSARQSLALQYCSRSQINVQNSDATVAFCCKVSGSGTSKTLGYCASRRWTNVYPKVAESTAYRPYLVIDNVDKPEVAANCIIKFLQQHQVRVLNVCGHRDDRTAGVADFQKKVYEILFLVFK